MHTAPAPHLNDPVPPPYPPTHPQASKRAKKQPANKHTVQIKWSEYQEQHAELANDPDELQKLMPKHHKLRQPHEMLHPPFDEVRACGPAFPTPPSPRPPECMLS